MVELPTGSSFSVKNGKECILILVEFFTTLKYKKKFDQKLKLTNNTFLHTGVDHSCRE